MQIANHDADDVAEDEGLHHHGHEREGHAEDGQQQVADRQVQQVHVGDGPHLLVSNQRQDHQAVARHRQKKNDRVRDGQESGHFVGGLDLAEAGGQELGAGGVGEDEAGHGAGVGHVVQVVAVQLRSGEVGCGH